MNDTLVPTQKYSELKKLSLDRDKLKKDEKDTKAYHFSTPNVMFEHFKAKKERKKIENQIFELIKHL